MRCRVDFIAVESLNPIAEIEITGKVSKQTFANGCEALDAVNKACEERGEVLAALYLMTVKEPSNE